MRISTKVTDRGMTNSKNGKTLENKVTNHRSIDMPVTKALLPSSIKRQIKSQTLALFAFAPAFYAMRIQCNLHLPSF